MVYCCTVCQVADSGMNTLRYDRTGRLGTISDIFLKSVTKKMKICQFELSLPILNEEEEEECLFILFIFMFILTRCFFGSGDLQLRPLACR